MGTTRHTPGHDHAGGPVQMGASQGEPGQNQKNWISSRWLPEMLSISDAVLNNAVPVFARLDPARRGVTRAP